jgi:hypothetical protein
LDVIALRNVFRKAIDEGWLKTLPTENLRPLKWTPKKRTLFSSPEIEAICSAAFKPLFVEGRLTGQDEKGQLLQRALLRVWESCLDRTPKTLPKPSSASTWGIGATTASQVETEKSACYTCDSFCDSRAICIRLRTGRVNDPVSIVRAFAVNQETTRNFKKPAKTEL